MFTSYAVPFPQTVICINAAPYGAALVYTYCVVEYVHEHMT